MRSFKRKQSFSLFNVSASKQVNEIFFTSCCQRSSKPTVRQGIEKKDGEKEYKRRTNVFIKED